MPTQKAKKTGLLAKLGDKLKKAHETHKNDETKFGNRDLPAGIENGKAELVECKVGEYEKGPNKGKLFFYAAGTVKSPTHHGGVKIEGQRTQISEPLFDTPQRTRKTTDEHIAWMYNELRKLGLDTSELDFDDLEGAMESLKESGVTFLFRTWKGQKATSGRYKDQEPRTNHDWQGVTEADEEETADVVDEDDETSAKTEEDEEEETDKEKEEEEASEEDTDTPDLEALAEVADGDDEDAASEASEKLTELAIEAGLDKAKVKKAANWGAVVEMIRQAQKEGAIKEADEEEEVEEEQEEESDAKIPEKGENYYYTVLDSKGKPIIGANKKPKKPVEVEVIAVDKTKETVTLKNLDDKKTLYKNVPFDQLQAEQE